MLGYLMDCWFAGIALTLIFYIYQWLKEPFLFKNVSLPNLTIASFGLGAAVFLFSHFLMQFWIVWTAWD